MRESRGGRALVLAGALALVLLLGGCGEQGSALIVSTAVRGGATATVGPPATPPPSATTVAEATPTATAVSSAMASHAHTPMPAATGGPVATASPTAVEASANVVEVRIVDFAFDPPVVIVPVGTTVVWVNVEGYHTVLSADFRLNSPILENVGDRYSYTFTEEGLHDYICGVHPDMLGVVQVVR